MTGKPGLAAALRAAKTRLAKAGNDTPDLDARLLLERVTGYSHSRLIAQSGDALSPEQHQMYESYIERRLAGEPVHRILARREFYGRAFQLSKDTLIPRPDTETLIDHVLNRVAAGFEPHSILDIGTGSGAIAITLAAELPSTRVTATDLSDDALLTAGKNAVEIGVSARMDFLQSDLFDKVEGRFDLIVSNPPYIPSADIAMLDVEVRDHDPALALDGGADGLDFYRRLLCEAGRHLNDDGLLIMEFGIGQATSISKLAEGEGWETVSVLPDLSGIDRVIELAPSAKRVNQG